MNKYIKWLAFLVFFIFPAKVQAVCPICTVAVGAGLGVSRYFGIDDLITGLWIGALVLSMVLWFADVIEKKSWPIRFPRLSAGGFLYFILFLTLVLSGIIGIPGNLIFGIDKLFLGICLGSFVFYFASLTDRYLKTRNKGQVIFYYQKVIIPVFLLSLLSFTIYLLI